MNVNSVEAGMISKVLNDSATSFKGNDFTKTANSSTSFSSIMSGTQVSTSTGKGSQYSNEFLPATKSTTVASSNPSASQSDISKKQSSTTKNETVASTQNNTKDDSTTVEETYGSELADKVKKILGLTDKELEDLLSKMGLNIMDLFNPEIMQQVVLENFGASNVSEALFNEDLANALLNSSKALEEIVAALEQEIVSLPEMETTGESFEKILSTTEESGDEESVNTKESSESKEIKLEIEKESTTEKNHGATDSSKNSSKDGRGQSDAQTSSDDFIDFFANKVQLNNVGNENITIPEFKQIVTEVVDQIKLNISPAKTSIEMVLNPESLGKVQVVVANKNGVLTAQLKVENEIAKEALESSIQVLKESFEGQGLKVQKVEVTIGNYTNEYAEHEGSKEQQGGQNAKKKIVLDDYMDEAGDSLVEEQQQVVSSMTGTIEYTA